MPEFQEQLQAAFHIEKDQVIQDCASAGDAASMLLAVANVDERLNTTLSGVLEHAGVNLDCRDGCDYCCSFKFEVGG